MEKELSVSLQKKLQQRQIRRTFRVRNKLVSKGLKPRITIFKSLNHIYAQVIDDASGKTLVSYSSLQMKDNKKQSKKEVARLVGMQLGNVAIEQGIKDVFFDRGRFPYHGRVQELAQGLREAGLNF